MDASPSLIDCGSGGTGDEGGLAVDGIECQSGSSIGNHLQTEAPK
jgi:hypothetical protein